MPKFTVVVTQLITDTIEIESPDGNNVEDMALDRFNNEKQFDLDTQAVVTHIDGQPQPKPYTIILAYPDYFDGETWMGHVEATDPTAAVKQARHDCAVANDPSCKLEAIEDLKVIAVVEGHLTDLNPQP